MKRCRGCRSIVRAAFVLTAAFVAAQPAAAQSAPAAPPAAAAPRPANSAAMYEFLLARRAEAQDDAVGRRSRPRAGRRARPVVGRTAGRAGRVLRAPEPRRRRRRRRRTRGELSMPTRKKDIASSAWSTPRGPTAWSKVRPAARRRHGGRRRSTTSRIQTSPTMATDLGLQMTLARQLMAADAAGQGGAAAGARSSVRPVRLASHWRCWPRRIARWAVRPRGRGARAGGGRQSALLPGARRRLRAAGEVRRGGRGLREGHGGGAWSGPRAAPAARGGAAQHPRRRRRRTRRGAADRVRQDQPQGRHRRTRCWRAPTCSAALARTRSAPPARRWRSSRPTCR